MKRLYCYGQYPINIQAGDGSVVIDPTDSRGNTIINLPMAVGHGAMEDQSQSQLVLLLVPVSSNRRFA
jgi:hypothetical protein